MKLGSDCSGSCKLCVCNGACLAGHGDDDFTPISKEDMLGELKTALCYKNLKWAAEVRGQLMESYGLDVTDINS